MRLDAEFTRHEAAPREAPAPTLQHIAHFYESGAFPVEEVSQFLGTGLATGVGCVAIGTLRNQQRLFERLSAGGLNWRAARERGQFIVLDAHETLASLMVDGELDAERFHDVVGTVLAGAAAYNRSTPARAFGEMVDLLCAEGKRAAAVRLEELWNELLGKLGASLLCTYSIGGFSRSEDALPFGQVCDLHSRIIPVASYTDLGDPGERLRTVALLQQKARSLEGEVARRKTTEALLRERERELEKRMRELADSDRRKDEFLAVLSHELRNPLAPLQLAVTAVRMRMALGQDPDPPLDVIERQAASMARLVDDLLDVSRITRGAIELRRERVRVAAIVARAVETVQHLVQQQEHKLAVQPGPDGLELFADPVRLEQVLVNLLVNAARYTPPGGEIALAVRSTRDHVELHVRDSGIGIAPEALDRVFDLFERASAGRNPVGGLGVGLTVARRLVELHDGSIEARSEGLGRGAEFVVRIPCGPAAAAGAEQPRGSPIPGQPLRVLVVDDNTDAAEMLAELLHAGLGHETRVAYDGHSALRLADEFAPDLVLLDIGLPELDGYEVARALRSAACPSRLVAVTGYGQAQDRERSHQAGFADHLVKPVQIDALLRVLEAARS